VSTMEFGGRRVSAGRGDGGERSRLAPAVVVTSDAHVGPRLEEDLRPYVAKRYLDAFDAWRASAVGSAVSEGSPGKARQVQRNLKTAGHYDFEARLRDMDEDGVAAEIVFHDSLNGQSMPFQGNGFFYDYARSDLELVAVGYDVYNRWLGDQLSAYQPARHAALAYLPMWDVEQAGKAAERARGLGLRAVNFPSPRPGLLEYDDPVWDPFWTVCAALEMPLCTHAGGAPLVNDGCPHGGALRMMETGGGWPVRRGMHRMILGGVFQRHPRLKLVYTETSPGWVGATMREMDSAWSVYESVLQEQCPRKPSEYFASNVYLGASFPAPFETEEAVRDGFIDNVMWGSDYPHPEGTWQPAEDGSPSTTRAALQFACAGISVDAARRLVGETAVEVYGFDRGALSDVAHRIGAPSLDEILTPLDKIPDRDYSMAFRTSPSDARARTSGMPSSTHLA
jgi:predicted TIM-barrel fold metal-dependent hydrolase